MRKCCCCSVKTGAVILGLLNFVIPLLIIVPLAGYWSGTDIDGLDILRDNQKVLEKVLEGEYKHSLVNFLPSSVPVGQFQLSPV